ASIALAAGLIVLSQRVTHAASVAVVLGVTALATLFVLQLRVWRDSTTLFVRCIELSSDDLLTNDVFLRWANFHSFRGNLSAAKAVLALAERRRAGTRVRAEIGTNISQA